ncbi:MAG: cyclic nucleotide-binding domain-containing protein [Actinomycetota bacterium]|nr:cyclic nucleotide-binding domain-containing protein [Actinomycetota bacterium]
MSATAAELSGIPLFDSLSESEREQLAKWFDVETAGEGVRLTGEGASGYSFFVLLDGSAAVTSAGAEIATLLPGDFFGEMAILGDGRRSATVTTTSPSRVLTLFGTEFRQLQQAHPQIAERIEAATRERATNRG